MKILLFPTAPEAEALAQHRVKSGVLYHHSDECAFICTGPGGRTAQTIRSLTPHRSLLATVGYAGALLPSLRPGDVFVADTFLRQGRPALKPSPVVEKLCRELRRQRIPCHRGSSFTTSHVVSQQAQKDHFREQGAGIVEMEDYWAAQVAFDIGCEFFSMRFVLDSYSFSLPDLSATLSGDGQISPLATMLHFALHPHHIPAAMKLRRMTCELAPRVRYCCRLICRSL